jgi:hypothetical protein
MSDEVAKKSLVAKIAEACLAVKGVAKGGRNQKQGYDYMKTADIAKSLREELLPRGVIITWDDKEFVQIRSIKTNAGGEMAEFLLKSEITFHDSDSADKLGPYGAFGVAMDTGDKSLWKAKTGQLKYVLRSIGLMPDEKSEPEGDENVDKALAADETLRVQEAKMEGQERIPAFQVKAFFDACDRNGHGEAQIKQFLMELNNYVQVEEIHKSDWEACRKWAFSPSVVPQQLAKPLKASVAQVKTQKPVESPANADREKVMRTLYASAKDKGIIEADFKQWAYETFSVDSLTKLDVRQLNSVIDWVKGV